MALDPKSVARLHAAFEDHYDAVLAYASYRTTNSEDAEEIASATYLSAWRRILDMPGEPATLPWLYGVAKKTLANQQRAITRRGALADKLARQARSPLGLQVADGRLEAVIARLTSDQQTLIELSSWNEVSYVEGAAILKCSANAYAIRLHRARVAVKVALNSDMDRETAALRRSRR